MVILVAEDIADSRDTMRLLLELKGHVVVEAANGEEAVQQARLTRPELILMDLGMPVMDGLTAARALREEEDTASIPIVAVSAFLSDAEWRERALRCGCNACMTKPVDFDALDELLMSASTLHEPASTLH